MGFLQGYPNKSDRFSNQTIRNVALRFYFFNHPDVPDVGLQTLSFYWNRKISKGIHLKSMVQSTKPLPLTIIRI